MQPDRMLIDLIAGARPNFVKIAPLWHALKKQTWCETRIIHTGQHSDIDMSEWFFRDLSLSAPHHHLAAQTGSHAQVTGSTMIAYERLCLEQRPDWTIVVGDVDSTVACGLAAKKLGIRVAHLEAGLRSGDRSMPEELNRVITDSIADLLWTPSPDADANLVREGIDSSRIEFIGNIMIDALIQVEDKIAKVDRNNVLGQTLEEDYAVVTLHRPSNVDDPALLRMILAALNRMACDRQIVFPVHPRTRHNIERFGLMSVLSCSKLLVSGPLSYIDFIALIRDARFLLTDSGGIQEETSFLGVPCLTLRPNTERPITISEGTNRLTALSRLDTDLAAILSRTRPAPPVIKYWDGKTAQRAVASLHHQ